MFRKLFIQIKLPDGAETLPNPDVLPAVHRGGAWEGSRCWIHLRQQFLEQNSLKILLQFLVEAELWEDPSLVPVAGKEQEFHFFLVSS